MDLHAPLRRSGGGEEKLGPVLQAWSEGQEGASGCAYRSDIRVEALGNQLGTRKAKEGMCQWQQREHGKELQRDHLDCEHSSLEDLFSEGQPPYERRDTGYIEKRTHLAM